MHNNSIEKIIQDNCTLIKTTNEILSFNEIQKFNSFVDTLINERHIAKILFRGDNFSNVKLKLKLNSDNEYQTFNQFLFLIGEKGRVYRDKYKREILDKSKIYPIDSTNREIFASIFKKLNQLFKKHLEKYEVAKCKENNSSFYHYFSDNRNKDKFLSIVSEIRDKNSKIKIRDYYLWLLHKIGQVGFYNNSFLLSTTTNYNIAVEFSYNAEHSERLIFICWIPYPLRKSAISINYINQSRKTISKLNLPIYNRPFYMNQNEISLKGGILPHFILGYLKYSTKDFIINPNLFTDNRNPSEIIKDGFKIDQSGFHKALNKTDYSGYFYIDHDRKISDCNI